MFEIPFQHVQPMQWWVYGVFGLVLLILLLGWGGAEAHLTELDELWKDAERLKGKMLNERYDLVSFNKGRTYYQVFNNGRLELADGNLVAMVKAYRAAESLGLDPTKLEQLGPIFTRKAPPPVDIDGDGKPAGGQKEYISRFSDDAH